MAQRWFVSVLPLIATLVLPVAPGWSKGSVAIGLPGNVAKGGVAVGVSYNYTSDQTADAEALKKCQDAPDAMRPLCKVDTHFENQCFAMAMDPQPGTYGVGYKVAATQHDADISALANCQRSSTANRSQYCQITYRTCDGTAK
jgi:hypothetical protein